MIERFRGHAANARRFLIWLRIVLLSVFGLHLR